MDQGNPEDEYFAKIEAEKKARMAQALENESATQQIEALKAAHYMRCGKCGQKMMTTVFKGVEIEVCPGCGAVLLDPGELELLAGDDQSDLFHNLAEIFGFAAEEETP